MIVNVAPLLKQPIGEQIDIHVAESPIDPKGENSGLLEAGAVSIEADIVATHTNPGAYFEGEADVAAVEDVEDVEQAKEGDQPPGHLAQHAPGQGRVAR